jgi:hypothetical protein
VSLLDGADADVGLDGVLEGACVLLDGAGDRTTRSSRSLPAGIFFAVGRLSGTIKGGST